MTSDETSPRETQFVAKFDTEVTDSALEQLAETLVERVGVFRERLGGDDDRIETLLTSDPGDEKLLTADDAEQGSTPEEVTKTLFIEPLLERLGYPEPATEPGDYSDEYVGEQADYGISLTEYDDIGSRRLLFEAEPLNKPLHSDDHGLGQVRSWLRNRDFDADFGIGTDGRRWELIKYDPDSYGFDSIASVDLGPALRAAFEYHTLGGDAEWWHDEDVRASLAAFYRAFAFRNFLSVAGEAREVIRETKERITDDFYDEYVRVVFGITPNGDDERASRSLVGDGIVCGEDADGDDRRLFAVTTMNRLVFVKFLEDRGLVAEDLLATLKAEHEESTVPRSMYKTYLEELFFGVLDERPGTRSPRIRELSQFEGMPYLNGGLFRPSSAYAGEGVTDRSFDVRDTVLFEIVELLERYDFSADGGPDELDPSILGNVFEKTINYITTDSGDQKKELGAYYTPDEITSFCAEQTVRPGLLAAFRDVVVEERGWPRAEVEQYDTVFELIEGIPQSGDLLDALLDAVDEFRALDPACGSGHFLTSVESEIVAVREALYDKHPDAEKATWELRKETVVRNVYGVDIVQPAVEIAKLRLWLSIISEVDPETVADYEEGDLALPNVVFNVRQGNSLIGFTGLVEEAAAGDDGTTQLRMGNFGANQVEQKYGGVIEQIELHKDAGTSEEATRYLQRAERLIQEFRDDLDPKILTEFHEAGLDDVDLEQVRSYDPFHWVLEFAPVYADGGFDVIVGNPPWERLKPLRDDYFVRYDPEFRTRLPDDKDAKQDELLADPEIAEGWEQYKQNLKNRAQYYNNSPAYEMQEPEVGGRKVGADNDLSALFLERVFKLARDDGKISQVLPGTIFTGASGKDLRRHLLSGTDMSSLMQFMNRGIFDGIDSRYKFAICTFENSGKTDEVVGAYREGHAEILDNLEEDAFGIPRQVLEDYSPEARIFPLLKQREEVEILSKILANPPIADKSDEWYVEPYRELDRTTDRDRFVENASEGDYPVFGGSNVYQFSYDPTFIDDLEPPKFWSVTEDENPSKSAKHRIRGKNVRNLKSDLYEAFDGTGSMKSFVNQLLEEKRGSKLEKDDVLLDCSEYRIVYRDITSATNERTIVAGVIPKGIVCHNKLHTVRPYKVNPDEDDLLDSPLHSVYERVFTDKQLFVALGLINSIPFDYLMKTKIDTTVVMYKFRESQVPRLTEGDDWFDYISTRAAKLNCYGEEFAEMRDRLGGLDPATDPQKRQRLQAEIDAAAFHAYGLDRAETKFVLDDFHKVRDPRIMTEEYFALVLRKYDELADANPEMAVPAEDD